MDKKKKKDQPAVSLDSLLVNNLSLEDLQRRIRLHIQDAQDRVKEAELKRLQAKELTSEEKVLLGASL